MGATYDEAKRNRLDVLGQHGLDSVLWSPQAREFLGDFHEFTVTTAYGDIWGRGTLSRRERRLITLTALIVNGYDEEFRLHVEAALDEDLTVPEIREIIIHLAAYIGFPAALAAFKKAWPVVRQRQQEEPAPGA